MAELFVSWDFKGSGMAELKNIDMKLFYNLLFSGHFESYTDSFRLNFIICPCTHGSEWDNLLTV